MSFANVEQYRSELTPEHAEVIRATLPLVGANIDKIAKQFYASMFEGHPELIRNLFNRGNQKQGAQQRALAASVATFATMLVTPGAETPERLLGRIGHKHVSLGITRDQYQIVHDYLFGAIVTILGADVVTAPVAEAWENVYWIMANLLIKFEAELYEKAGVKPGEVFVNTQVVERKDLSGGIVEFTVESKDASKPLPAHQPGQYISVGAKLPDGARQLRQYSLVDAGINPGRLTIAVKSVEATKDTPAGEVSNWLINNVKKGDDLEITLPFGDLVLNQKSQRPVVLISRGIGITPMLGILSYLAASNSSRATLSLHADSSASTDAFFDERTKLVSKMPSGEAKTWYSEGQTGPNVSQGHLDLSTVQLPVDAEIYLCGGNEFLQRMRKQLKDMKVPDERVYFELFSPNDWLLDQ